MKTFLFTFVILVIMAMSSSFFLSGVEKNNPYTLIIHEKDINPGDIQYENLYQVSCRDIAEIVSWEGRLKEEECLIHTQTVSNSIADKYLVGQYVEASEDFNFINNDQNKKYIHILKIEKGDENSEITYSSSGDIVFSIWVDKDKSAFITQNTVFEANIGKNKFLCKLYSIGRVTENEKIEIQLIFHDETADVFPGEKIRVEFVSQEKSNVICIPQSCLGTDSIGNKSVYKYNGDIYEFKYVEIGICDETYVEVLSGLNEGDIIIDND